MLSHCVCALAESSAAAGSMRSGDVDTIALPTLGEDDGMEEMEEMEEMELELDEDDFHSDVHNLLRTTRATQRGT